MNVEVVKQGDLFSSGCDALVNATNCVGVMGAGLARAFAVRYPAMEKDYVAAYKKKELKLGVLHTYKNPETDPKAGEYKWIVNFPTMHFPGEVTLKENLEKGFVALGEFVKKNKIKSIAIPALGCGIGSFSWAEFLPMVEAFAEEFPKLKIKAYEPLERK
jgi:O-acetyl-ADP-ribose deacetylase (regulator of RNase III)